MKKINIKKFILLALIIFLIWNLSWFLITTIKYSKYMKVVPKNKWGTHSLSKEGYSYNVKRPFFFSFTGNLGVTNKETGDVLIIWPKIWGGYKYGAIIKKDQSVYQIYIDENLNPINKDDLVAAQKINEYRAELQELFLKANNMWELK